MAAPKSDKEATRDGAKKKRGGTVDADAVVAAVTAAKEELNECPECGSKCLICDYGKAEIFCQDCGLIITENIVDLGPEWRAFDSEQKSKRARTGAPMTYRIHDKGLSTVVSSGSGLSPGEYKLKKWQQRTHVANTTERSFIFALSEIDRMASALRLPVNIREAASMLYRKAMKKRLIRGRSIEGITSALLYIGCRQYGVPRTLEELSDVSRVGQKEISRAYRFLLRELDLKVSPASPVDFVPRFCSLLNLGGDIRSKAVEIIKKATEAELTNGRGPIGIAAAAIYIAAILSGEHRTQKEVSNVTGVTEVTIRNRYKELSEQLEIPELLAV
ncbi:Transcription initiation factor IIB [ANME-1 cluster archaeon GoMg1]|nr:Transcription initiation factor IIB [ANME-1 cluster archaeon GoMg1]